MKHMKNRNKMVWAVYAAMLTLLVPTFAWAAGGDLSEVGRLAVFHLINLIILVGALVYFVRKPLKTFLVKRKNQVTAELEEAKKLHENARTMLKEYQERFDGLEKERETLLAEYRSLGEAERDRIIAEATQRAEKIGKEAELTVAQEISAAKAALEAEVLQLATEMAEKALRQDLKTPQHKALVEGFLGDLEKQASAR